MARRNSDDEGRKNSGKRTNNSRSGGPRKSSGGFSARKKSPGDKPFGDKNKSDDRSAPRGKFSPRKDDSDRFSKPKAGRSSAKSFGDKRESGDSESRGKFSSRKTEGDRFSKPRGERPSSKSFSDKRNSGDDLGSRGKKFAPRKSDDRFSKPKGPRSFDKPFDGERKRSSGSGFSRDRNERKDSDSGKSSYDNRSKKRYSDSGKFSKGRDDKSGTEKRDRFSKGRDEKAPRSREDRFSKDKRSDFSGRSEGFSKGKGERFPMDKKGPARSSDKKDFKSRSDEGKGRFDSPKRSEGRDERRPARAGARPRTVKKEIAKEEFKAETPVQTGQLRLNRFIANSGVCSRREADELITMGLISVNGKTITEMGYKVNPGDEVRYEDRVLRAERPVYILLNKPKGFLTTTSDPQERNTVMHLIANAVKERVYPVGRLDRNTTGLLLLTNDGDLADKLMHPSYNVKKIYKVELDKALTKVDFQKIQEGIDLEEGKAVVDDIAIVSDEGRVVGVELHIGWNRVVRRIFESLGYTVEKLDRSVYAGLDKKDLPRGHWRFLRKEEIVHLKHYK